MKLNNFTPIECFVQCLAHNEDPIIMLTLEILICEVEARQRTRTTQDRQRGGSGESCDSTEHNLKPPDLSLLWKPLSRKPPAPITPSIKLPPALSRSPNQGSNSATAAFCCDRPSFPCPYSHSPETASVA